VARSPSADASLERPPLRIWKLAGVLILQPLEQGESPQLRVGLQASLHLRPDIDKGIFPRSPGSPFYLVRR
jgi:hypothetical protein